MAEHCSECNLMHNDGPCPLCEEIEEALKTTMKRDMSLVQTGFSHDYLRGYHDAVKGHMLMTTTADRVDEPKRIKLAYISGPYSAPTLHEIYANIMLASKYAEKYWKLGYGVFCPHLNSAFMDGVVPYGRFIDADLEFLRRFDVIVMMPNWRSSNGAAAELKLAKELEKEIIYE